MIGHADVFEPGVLPITAARLRLVEPADGHTHEFFEVAIVTDGAAAHVSEAGTTCLHPGRLVLIAPGGWHGYAPEPSLRVAVVRIGSGVLRRTLAWLGRFGGVGYLFDVTGSLLGPRAVVWGQEPP